MKKFNGIVVILLLTLICGLITSGCGNRAQKPEEGALPPGDTPEGPKKKASGRVLVVDDIFFAFEEDNLKVTDPVFSKEEKARVDAYQKRIDENRKSGGSDVNLPVDARVRLVEGIPVSIRRFRDSYRPREIFEASRRQQEEAKKKAAKSKAPFYRITCLVKGPFVLKIHHFKTAEGGRRTLLKIDPSVLSRIEKAFMSDIPGDYQGSPTQ